MRKRDKQTRQLMGCGYESAPTEELRPHVERGVWDHPGRVQSPDERDDRGRLRLPVCPGYVCALPEVIEASHAMTYKRNGELGQFCEGQSTESLRDAMDVIEREQNRVDNWKIQNPQKKGG